MKSFKEYRQELNEDQTNVASPNLAASLMQLQDSLVSMVNRLSLQTINYLDKTDVEDNPLDVMRQNLSWKQKLGNWWNRVWYGNNHASQRESTEYELEFPDDIVIEKESFNELVELISEYGDPGPVNLAKYYYTSMIQRMNGEINNQIKSQFKTFIVANKDLLSGKTNKSSSGKPVNPSASDTEEQPGDLNAASPQAKTKPVKSKPSTVPPVPPDNRPSFEYEGLDKYAKMVKGKIQASDHNEAKEILDAMGVFVTKLMPEFPESLVTYHYIIQDRNTSQVIKGTIDAVSRVEAMQKIHEKYKDQDIYMRWVDKNPPPDDIKIDPTVDDEPEGSHVDDDSEDIEADPTVDDDSEDIEADPTVDDEPEDSHVDTGVDDDSNNNPEELPVDSDGDDEDEISDDSSEDGGLDNRPIRHDIVINGVNRLAGVGGHGLVKSVDINGKNYSVKEASYDYRGTLKWVTLSGAGAQKKYSGIIPVPKELGEKYGVDSHTIKGAREGLVKKIQSDISNGILGEFPDSQNNSDSSPPRPRKKPEGVAPPGHGTFNIKPSNSHEVPEMDPDETEGDIDSDDEDIDNEELSKEKDLFNQRAKEKWANMPHEGQVNHWLELLKDDDPEQFEEINPKFFSYLTAPQSPEKDSIMAFLSGLSETLRFSLLRYDNKLLDSDDEDLGKLFWVSHLSPDKAKELGKKINKRVDDERMKDIFADRDSFESFINENTSNNLFKKERNLVLKENIKEANIHEQVKIYKRKLRKLSK